MEIKIPGLDVNSGLNLYDGDYKIYLSALRLYVSKTPAVLDRIRNVSAETLQDYTIGVHGIKGTSEYIGAEETRKTARQLEAMAKADDLAGVLAQNNAFIKHVENLIGIIRDWLEKYDAAQN